VLYIFDFKIGGMLSLRVKPLNLELCVAADATVGFLARHAARSAGVHEATLDVIPHALRVVFCDVVLPSVDRLSDHGICDDATVSVTGVDLLLTRQTWAERTFRQRWTRPTQKKPPDCCCCS
jgi:hypothetical protein